MSKRVLIVGGGTAGWITAAYMARMLAADTPGGVSITLVESDEIGILGVGEGTFPIIRKTMSRIGLDESELIREADATFKQGIRFNHWKKNPADHPHDTYFHPFQVCSQHTDMDLLPYWLLGVAGDAHEGAAEGGGQLHHLHRGDAAEVGAGVGTSRSASAPPDKASAAIAQ